MDDKDEAILDKILEEIEFIADAISNVDKSGFLSNAVLQHATVMALVNIGELANSLSDDVRAHGENCGINWFKIVGLRNIAAHSYGILDMPRIWETLMVSVPELKANLSTLIIAPL
jgi:uncharacterized protein with HEPN domain